MSQKRSFNKLAFKLSALFLIVILPLTLFACMVYATSYQSLRQKTLDSIAQNGEQISMSIDQSLQNVFSAQNAMNVDDKIMYMIVMNNRASDFQRYINMLDVLNRLSTVRLSQSCISEIRLHIPVMNKTLMSNGTATQLQDECQYYMQEMEHFYMLQADWNHLTLGCVYPWLAQNNYAYYLITEIDCQELTRSILMPHTHEHGNTYLFMEDDHKQPQLIACYGEKALFDPFTQLTTEVNGVSRIVLEGEMYLASVKNIGFFDLKVLLLTPEADIFHELKVQNSAMWAVLLIATILILFFIQMIMCMINHPLKRLSSAFAEVQSGHLNAEIISRRKDEFGEIYACFNSMTSQIKRLIDENYSSRLLVQEIKLRQLQAQVNPHFLYNSFRNIYAMAQLGDYEGILEITEKLTAFYRYTAQTSGDTVQLYQEDEYACAYLGIQGIRFEDQLEVRLEPLPHEMKNAPALHFSIQTIAENACKYAQPTRPQDAVIALSYQEHPDGYVVAVDDNGTAMTDDKIEELNRLIPSGEVINSGTGLINLQQRLQMRWGKQAGLSFSRSALGGLRVEMYVYWKKDTLIQHSS